jgi:hypothetical protein
VDLTRPAEIAEALGVSDRWLRSKVRELSVPHVNLGRGRMAFTAEQVDALYAALTVDGRAATSRSRARQPRKGRAA